METLAFLGRTLGFSFAAGINLYATVALIGLASRYGWVALPAEYAMFDNPWVIGAAIVLHAVSFIPVTLLGVVYMAREGLSFQRAQAMASSETS